MRWTSCGREWSDAVKGTIAELLKNASRRDSLIRPDLDQTAQPGCGGGQSDDRYLPLESCCTCVYPTGMSNRSESRLPLEYDVIWIAISIMDPFTGAGGGGTEVAAVAPFALAAL